MGYREVRKGIVELFDGSDIHHIREENVRYIDISGTQRKVLEQLVQRNKANMFLWAKAVDKEVRDPLDTLNVLFLSGYAARTTANRLYRAFGFWNNGSPSLPEKLEYATGYFSKSNTKSRGTSWRERLSRNLPGIGNPSFYIANVTTVSLDGTYRPVYERIFDFEMPKDKVPIKLSIKS